jgi:hypothetical protein
LSQRISSKPLGKLVPNPVKYFAAATLDELQQEASWHFRATETIMQYWRKKHQKKNGEPGKATDKSSEVCIKLCIN